METKLKLRKAEPVIRKGPLVSVLVSWTSFNSVSGLKLFLWPYSQRSCVWDWMHNYTAIIGKSFINRLYKSSFINYFPLFISLFMKYLRSCGWKKYFWWRIFGDLTNIFANRIPRTYVWYIRDMSDSSYLFANTNQSVSNLAPFRRETQVPVRARTQWVLPICRMGKHRWVYTEPW